MPPGFGFPEVAELWIPLEPEARATARTDRSIGVVGRLRSGVSTPAADAEVRTFGAALAAPYPSRTVAREHRHVGCDRVHGESARA